MKSGQLFGYGLNLAISCEGHMKKYFVLFGELVLALTLGLLLVFLVLEGAAGCGATYTDSKGTIHPNECLFIR